LIELSVAFDRASNSAGGWPDRVHEAVFRANAALRPPMPPMPNLRRDVSGWTPLAQPSPPEHFNHPAQLEPKPKTKPAPPPSRFARLDTEEGEKP
jgi:hypothetical protein